MSLGEFKVQWSRFRAPEVFWTCVDGDLGSNDSLEFGGIYSPNEQVNAPEVLKAQFGR